MEVPSSSGIPCITLDNESEMETAGSTSLNTSLEIPSVTQNTNVNNEQENITKNSCASSIDRSQQMQERVEHLNNAKGSERQASELMKISEQQGQAENINQATISGNSKNTINKELRHIVDKCNRAKTQNTRLQSITLLKKHHPHYLNRTYAKLVQNMYNKSQNQWICTECKKSYNIKRAVLAKHLIVEHGYPIEYESNNGAGAFGMKIERDDESEKKKKPLVKQDKIQTSGQHPTDDSKKLLFFTIYLAKSFPATNLEPLRELFENLEYDSTIFQTLTENQNKYREYIKNAIISCFIKYLVRDIGESVYSIFINQYMNGNEKFLLLIIKYFSIEKNRIHTSFYRIIKIESENYATQIIVILSSDGLKIEKCGGFGLDTDINENLSNPITDILKNVNSRIVINMCSLQLLLSVVTKACSYLPENLAIMIKETYNCTVNSECSEKLTPITLQNTKPLIYNHQWFIEGEFIGFIIKEWNILKQNVNNIDNIFAKKLFEDDYNLTNLTSIYEILRPLLSFYNFISKESFDPFDLFQELRSILNRLNEYQNHLNQSGIEGTKNDFATKIGCCIQYLILELNKLIPEESDLLNQVTLFSRKNIPKRNQLNVSNIFTIYHSIPNIQLARKEWNLFLQEDESVIPDDTTEKCWIKIKDYSTDFKHLSQFVLQMLCLPFPIVEVKRIFDLATKFMNGATDELPIEIVEAFVIIHSQTEPNIIQICAEYADNHV